MKTPPEPGGGTPPEGNAEQVQYWNETAGPRWVAGQEALDARLAPYGEAAMDRVRIAAGAHVLDVGCGCGATTVEIARRVGANGSAVGADISRPMLEVARRRAPEIPFLEADAQTYVFTPSSFDVVFSRFGVMFFADPRAAFANLRKALRPTGRMAFICWQSVPKNPWVGIPLGVAARHVPLPPPPAPDAPGPFAFADSARVRTILEGAGFRDVAIDAYERPFELGAVDTAVGFLLELGPASALLREAGSEAKERVTRDLREALAPFDAGNGVELGSAAWIVTASA